MCGRGPSIAEARRRAYRAVDLVGWPGMHVRHDIARAAAAAQAGAAQAAATARSADDETATGPAADQGTEHADRVATGRTAP